MAVEIWQLEMSLEDALDSLDEAHSRACELYEGTQDYEEKSSTYFDEEHGADVTVNHDVPIEGTGWEEMAKLADELKELKARLEKATEPFKKTFEDDHKQREHEADMWDATSY